MSKLSKKQLYASIIIGTTIICLGAGMVVKAYSTPRKTTEETLVVRTKVIESVGTGQNYTYSGDVHGRYESQLAFQINGKIIKRNIELGSSVKPGDILMEINAKDVQQTVNINSAQIDSARAQLKLAASNLGRYQKLYAENAISSAQLEQYQTAYETALAGVNQASAQYSQGANQLDYSGLTTDKAGIVSAISAEVGQVVSAGQVVMTIVQDGEREVEINVPENRIDELRKTQQIKVSFWALPNISVDAKIREVSPMADKVSRTYKVRMSLVSPPPEVKLGMTATINVVTPSTKAMALYVPLSAIYQNGEAPSLWFVNDGVVNLRPIQVGAFGNEQVEVLAGVENGAVIVTAGVHRLREGQKVRVGASL